MTATQMYLRPMVAALACAQPSIATGNQVFAVEGLAVRPAVAAVESVWLNERMHALQTALLAWDSSVADPVRPSTVSYLRSVLTSARSHGDVRGSIVPGADGSVQAEWHRTDVSIGLLVEDDGQLSAWVRFADTGQQLEEFGADALEFFTALVTQYRLNV